MKGKRRLKAGLLAAFALGLLATVSAGKTVRIERVTTIAPFPRGLAMKDGKLYVLCRGRVRGAGGVSAEIEDQAGTIYRVDPNIVESIDSPEVGEEVRCNGEVLAIPASPPFHLWDRTAVPPQRDRYTDRPYCTLRYHAPSRSFYLCAFSGVDKRKTPADPTAFSKNLTDAVMRYDLRTKKWYEVERHDIEAGGNYPHHDPRYHSPPHGWLNGPDNCLALGHWLYAVAKDNSLLVRYDLRQLEKDPEAGPPDSEVVLGEQINLKGHEPQVLKGQSALAYHDGWLYIGYRTSSVVARMKLDGDLLPVKSTPAERIALFDPYDPETGRSANITDMDFDAKGRLYVISAKPARIYRFTPDAKHPFDAREGRAASWADLSVETGNPGMKCENLLHHDGWIYVTSGDGYSYQKGAAGTVYRIQVDD